MILLVPFFGLILIFGSALVALIVWWRRRQRDRLVQEIMSGGNTLAHWQYSASEWATAVNEEFTWVKHRDQPGQVFIAPAGIYIAGPGEDHLIRLRGQGKFVTHASYRGTDISPLKVRVRWKVVRRYRDAEHVQYHTEDYRIPVPPTCKADAERVVQWFTMQAEQNPDAVNSVTSPDAPLSLFSKEPFA